ncbi:amyloid beta precursor protein binding family B member 2-like [Babylonia areolata]|uniref:amyloid beta precursor protein binding family B member 2-like n=1 Tax=Babylonia areolata TaxID=304850 RepID=UPI003FD2DADD
MAHTPTMPDLPKDPDSSYLSFANPNYCFEDQVNWNAGDQSPTEEEDDSLSLDKLSVTDGSAPSGHRSAHSDYSSAEVTPSSPDGSFLLHKLTSRHSHADDTDDDTSSLDDEDDDDDDDDVNDAEDADSDGMRRSKEEVVMGVEKEEGGRKRGGRGILGYLTMLERQAQDPHCPATRAQVADWRGEGAGDQTPDDVDSQGNSLSREDSASHAIGKLEDGSYINSPDSNDSGIHSDARSDDGVPPPHSTTRGGPGGTESGMFPTHTHQHPYPPGGKKHLKGAATTPDTLTTPDTPDTPDSPDSVYEEVAVIQEEDKGEGTPSSQTPVLPPGWQKHEDEDGPYYWHIKSGTIQRDPPPPAPPDGPTLCTARAVRSFSLASDSSSQGGASSSSVASTPTSVASSTERHLQEFEGHALQYAARSLQTLSSPPDNHVTGRRVEEEEGGKGGGPRTIRFAVRSLGWVRIAEEDLTPERSSRAVNKCIVDLSLGRHDINDAVGRWGDGKDLFMDIDCRSLRLIDPADTSLLNSQPIHSIRVWGVGRDNGRDFAYVARDRISRVHMCHVFQCDTPARQIANTLRDICKHIMRERGIHAASPAESRLPRPTDLPNLDKLEVTFPTPMEEPRKIIRCHYLGCHEVSRPTGMDIVNESVDWMYYGVAPERWTFVNVAIAPSTITITEHGNPDNIVEECRVRFLSFMGISIASVKLCAFVMHTAQNKFMSHVFHCEPSAGPLCKTIEAACKLRYQKCLDAHPQTPKAIKNGKSVGAMWRAGVKASIQSILGMVKTKAGMAGAQW